MREAVVSLSRQFGISRRQAYRYLQEAETIGHPVPVVAPSVPITLKIPGNIVGEVRAYSVISGLTLSEIVTRAITAFLTAACGAWLTGGRVGIDIKSSLITHLVVCSIANVSRSTSGWFPTRCGLLARVQR